MDKDKGFRHVFPMESFFFHLMKDHMVPHFSSVIANTIHRSQSFRGLPSGFLFKPMEKALTTQNIPLSDSSILSIRNRSSFIFLPSLFRSSPPLIFDKFSKFVMRFLHRTLENSERYPVVSLPNELAPQLNQPPSSELTLTSCELDRNGLRKGPLSDSDYSTNSIELTTGIEFPLFINPLSALAPEVLVGTGSRTMKIIRIKTLKVYAFGFYINPYSLCKKLGPKYGSLTMGDLDNENEFFQDLLREDIGMSVRLVINCNGIKINTVRDAFEKSLRGRLLKTNPDADFGCLKTFGSFFTEDISIPAGTTVEFRRTTEGRFITEIGGNQIGQVHSKELCTAFFDMYIGDGPVSEQTKEEIGRNVARIIGKC